MTIHRPGSRYGWINKITTDLWFGVLDAEHNLPTAFRSVLRPLAVERKLIPKDQEEEFDDARF